MYESPGCCIDIASTRVGGVDNNRYYYFTSFNGERNWASERLIELHKVTQPVDGRSEIRAGLVNSMSSFAVICGT